MLFDKELTAILAEVKTIAVIGANDSPGRPVDMVGRRLIEMGYTLIPVHPKRKNVWGLSTYAAMADIPHPVDVVDLFRASEYCLDHARECLDMPTLPKLFWMQSGIRNAGAANLLRGRVRVVEDQCLKVVLEQLKRGFRG